MVPLRPTLYPLALLSANTITAVGLYRLAAPPIAPLLGAVTLLLLAGIVRSQYDVRIPDGTS